MKLWRYIHLSNDDKTIPLSQEYKKPFIWSEINPDEDYIEVVGEYYENKLIELEKANYQERELQGKDYSNLMDARLIVLGKAIPNAELSNSVRALIDQMFHNARFQVSLGRWISAKREVEVVTENSTLQSLIETYDLPINQSALIQEVKDRINLAIEQLY